MRKKNPVLRDGSLDIRCEDNRLVVERRGKGVSMTLTVDVETFAGDLPFTIESKKI